VLRGTDTPLSDLDLLVDGNSTTLFDLGRAISDLKKVFGIRFHIHTSGSLADSFRAAVLTEACPFTSWAQHAGKENRLGWLAVQD
jgi:predicted nucleotidyltransferase